MSRPNSKSNRELKEKYERDMAEKENEIDMLKELLEETKKTCREQVENEIAARKVLTAELEETKDRVCETGNYAGQKLSTQLRQLPLNACRKVNLKTWIIDTLYSDLKFISDETFNTSPKILEEAMKRMCVVNELERLQLGEATKREIKYQLSQKRAYSMKIVGKKYRGTKSVSF